MGTREPVHGREAGGEETGHGQQDDLADRGAERLEVAVADEQHADGEHQGHGNHQTHVPPRLGPGNLGALPEGDLVPGVGGGRGQEALEVGASEPAGQDERGDGLVDGGIPELTGEGEECGVQGDAALDADNQGRHVVAD